MSVVTNFAPCIYEPSVVCSLLSLTVSIFLQKNCSEVKSEGKERKGKGTTIFTR